VLACTLLARPLFRGGALLRIQRAGQPGQHALKTKRKEKNVTDRAPDRGSLVCRHANGHRGVSGAPDSSSSFIGATPPRRLEARPTAESGAMSWPYRRSGKSLS